MEKPKVLVTGAAGLVASLMLPALRVRYDLTLLDVRTTDRNGAPVDGVQIADLTERNREAYRHFFRGIDAVIHLGFVRPQDPEDSDQRFWAEFQNVQMAYNIYQVAWEESVRRVVAASSNHAADYYEPLILQHKMDMVTPDMLALSDNFYGWSKQAYEHLGFVFAAGKIHGEAVEGIQAAISGHGGATIADRVRGRQLENIQIRIGGPRETDIANCAPGDLTCMRRALAAYLSARDLTQLFVKSIETADIRDEHGVPFQIFYGISNNAYAFWSIASARKIIGYEPEDSSEINFAEGVAAHIAAAKAQAQAK
jgi:hypothetical protein